MAENNKFVQDWTPDCVTIVKRSGRKDLIPNSAIDAAAARVAAGQSTVEEEARKMAAEETAAQLQLEQDLEETA